MISRWGNSQFKKMAQGGGRSDPKSVVSGIKIDPWPGPAAAAAGAHCRLARGGVGLGGVVFVKENI